MHAPFEMDLLPPRVGQVPCRDALLAEAERAEDYFVTWTSSSFRLYGRFSTIFFE